MVQLFQPVAPRARVNLGSNVQLEGLLFEGWAKQFVRHLMVPVGRPQNGSSQHSPVNSTNIICGCGCTQTKRIRRSNNDVRINSSRLHKQIEVRGRNEKVTDAVVTLANLPPELKELIFSFIENIMDVIAFGMINRDFWSIGRECLDRCIEAHFGRWAGANIVFVGGRVDLIDDCQPGLYSTEELEVLRNEKRLSIRAYSGIDYGPHRPQEI